MRGEIGSDSQGNWQICVYFYDSGGGSLGYQIAAGGWSGTIGTEWQHKGGRITVPANAVTMEVYLLNYMTSGWVAFDDVSLEALAPVETWYYYFNGQRVAMREIDAGGEHVLYLQGDHLGSTSLVLDTNGARVAESRYLPYGGERWRWPASGTFPTDYWFTGQRLESSINLYHMGARWYDSELGRWISPDSIVPDPANPQSLNRYSYVGGNPLNFVDPTGHKEEGECGFNGEVCLDLSYLWDPTWYPSVADPEAAEQAFLLYLSNPEYYVALYTDPAAWASSQDVANLDVFLQYSVLGTTAAQFVSSAFDYDTRDLLNGAHVKYGAGDEIGANDLLLAAGYGIPQAAVTIYRGGAHAQMQAPGLNSHHLLAKSVSPIPEAQGPAIQMEPGDHAMTASHAWSRGSRAWRQQQGDLIRAGQMRDALAMAIKDVRMKFGSKYNAAIREAIGYAKGAGWLDKRQ